MVLEQNQQINQLVVKFRGFVMKTFRKSFVEKTLALKMKEKTGMFGILQ